MVTFSCCMIVKNEEKVLKRCLDSICDLMDEIIIVDTGSTDSTKEIARQYTDKIYDLVWSDDFSEARNYSFSKATMDYIYCPDADEYLDEENHRQLSLLKQFLDPEIEIVQMMYHTIGVDTVLNIRNEYRPKLYKRLRTFTWVDPVHETVRLNPVVFDSDIVITHAPLSNHAKRDFGIFKKAIEIDAALSDKVVTMYATELFKQGLLEDFIDAKDFFEQIYLSRKNDQLQLHGKCILVRFARLINDSKLIEKLLADTDSLTSELCYDFGMFYYNNKNYSDAISWLTKAINMPYCLDIHTCGDDAYKALCDIYQALGNNETELEKYSLLLKNWKLPEESMPQLPHTY